MKITNADLKKVLRTFNILKVDDDSYIYEKRKKHLNNDIITYNFILNNHRYIVLITPDIDFEIGDIYNAIREVANGQDGDLLMNPLTSKSDQHGLSFNGKIVYVFCVKSNKLRLDVILHNNNLTLSRSEIQKFIRFGRVKVNNIVIKKPSTLVNLESKISIDYPKKLDLSNFKLDIIYRDNNVIVINKPAGMLTHSKGSLNDEPTVADFFGKYTTYNKGTNRPGIVHRLDRDTSGVIVGALNDKSADCLKKQFSEHSIQKTYYAIIDGQPKEKQAIINLPIGRMKNSPSLFMVSINGKPAETYYKIINKSKHFSLVKLMPKTGRTHQLRVHMKAIGTPIHGDRLYNSHFKQSDKRLYLHAESLSIILPDGTKKTFTSQIPDDFLNLIKSDKNE